MNQPMATIPRHHPVEGFTMEIMLHFTVMLITSCQEVIHLTAKLTGHGVMLLLAVSVCIHHYSVSLIYTISMEM